jgi:hypothetical protein
MEPRSHFRQSITKYHLSRSTIFNRNPQVTPYLPLIFPHSLFAQENPSPRRLAAPLSLKVGATLGFGALYFQFVVDIWHSTSSVTWR